MKFLVVGHVCYDIFHPPDGGSPKGPDGIRVDREVERYGGIYNSLATLAVLLEQTDRVLPVFGVNKSEYSSLMSHLAQFPNVDPSGIFASDEPTNRVHHFYADSGPRIECSQDIARPIPFQRIGRFLSVDGIIINMVSGFDLTVDTLDQIRMEVRSERIPIVFDYHNLTLGVNQKNERYRRPLEDWRRMAFMIDILQLNEEEIAGLTAERLTEQQTVGHLLTLGGKGVLVTRGKQGATLFYNEHKRVVRKDIEGIHAENAQHMHGCGDVFGAAFMLHYVKTADMLAAAQFANRTAATTTTLPDLFRGTATALGGTLR